MKATIAERIDCPCGTSFAIIGTVSEPDWMGRASLSITNSEELTAFAREHATHQTPDTAAQ